MQATCHCVYFHRRASSVRMLLIPQDLQQQQKIQVFFSPLPVIVTILHRFFFLPLLDSHKGIIRACQEWQCGLGFSWQCSHTVWEFRNTCFRTPSLGECVQLERHGCSTAKMQYWHWELFWRHWNQAHTTGTLIEWKPVNSVWWRSAFNYIQG